MTVAEAVGCFPPADLAELTALADLQARVDRKYIVDRTVLEVVVASQPSSAAALELDAERAFDYRSQYFDTPDLLLYREAAQRRRRQFKVRTRSHGGSSGLVLEVKTKGRRGLTIKARTPHSSGSAAKLEDVDRRFIGGVVDRDSVVADLIPTLTTEYRRSTLVDRALWTRTTVDESVRCTDWRGAVVGLDDIVIETKSAGSASVTDRILWSMGIRPVRLSKFCTSLAALHPDLPSNRWSRTLRRHF
ncbi:MAG: polyphosphate polymerase domain-containing protein [Actinomycetota bacterium]|jgi:hypothetical protein|nr:polyphosphate polymerase domain-containing protein [Actinomycetota bacterium]